MSLESQFHNRDFGLIETLLWSKAQGFALLDQHVARLKLSAESFGFAFKEADFRTALSNAAVVLPREGQIRVRAVLQRGGALDVSHTPILPVAAGTVWRVARTKTIFDSRWPLLRHKTTLRALYEDEFAAASKQGADEVLFLNERGELCEGARCNLFVKRSGILLTPALECGLLPGTLRAKLLEEGKAKETILSPADLIDTEWFMGNSVRGLVRATLF